MSEIETGIMIGYGVGVWLFHFFNLDLFGMIMGEIIIILGLWMFIKKKGEVGNE